MLEQKIKELESFLPKIKVCNESVSIANIGWHIEHTTKSMYGISKALLASDPKKYKWTFNFYRYFFTYLNYIPRGRKAPKSVKVESSGDVKIIKKNIEKVRIIAQKLDALPKNSYFYHPYFGDMNKDIAIRFINVHAHHHLKIMKDILNASN